MSINAELAKRSKSLAAHQLQCCHVSCRVHLLDECGPAVVSCVNQAQGLGFRAHSIDDLVLVLLSKEIRDLSA